MFSGSLAVTIIALSFLYFWAVFIFIFFVFWYVANVVLD